MKRRIGGILHPYEFLERWFLKVFAAVRAALCRLVIRIIISLDGQIGTLEGYYLFEHERISKRSADPSVFHHGKLANEPGVILDYVMNESSECWPYSFEAKCSANRQRSPYRRMGYFRFRGWNSSSSSVASREITARANLRPPTGRSAKSQEPNSPTRSMLSSGTWWVLRLSNSPSNRETP